MKWFNVCRTGVAALALAIATCAAAQVQPLAPAAVAPPARIDTALRGNVLATQPAADYLACQAECQHTPGCTGYTFDRAAKASCTLLSGKLTDLAARGAVSCHMPCEPGPRATALTQRLPGTTLLNPAPAMTGAPDKPVGLLPSTATLATREAPAMSASATGTGSTQSASFGSGPVPYTPLPPCTPGRVSKAGSCSNAAVAAPVSVTITLVPINDNTIASSSLDAVYQNLVYQSNYWVRTSPGIGMGCDQLYLAGTGGQHISCARGLIKFNLASLAGKTIQSAMLRLTTSAAGVGNYKDPWTVAASASPWSGSTVTWINYGDRTYTASIGVQNAPTLVGQIFNLDQTATVRNWLSGAYANNGFAMALQREQLRSCSCISLDHFEFHSNEDAGGRGPKLIVTYQ